MPFPASRTTDIHMCPAFTGPVPHVGGPLLPMPPTRVLVVGPPSARLADFAVCVGPPDVVSQGASTVLVVGLPMTHMTAQSVHGGLIAVGAPTVLVGGPTFSIPANITLDGSASFKNKTVRDLYLLSTTPTGRELLSRLENAGQPMTIREHSGTNGFCTPNSGSDATAGTPTGSVIQYNPDYRSNAYDVNGNLLAQPPQVILAHEMAHGLANAEGHQGQGTDTAPPLSEPGIDAEEAQAIGTGSYNGTHPTENSLRSDLGLGRRDNHFGTGGPTAGEPPPLNLRPGGY